jgi:NADH:ubiquinone oxidoreductase subunit 5 (subunit L)/multisubunit Na+/H+ antiporter MnhA subunit
MSAAMAISFGQPTDHAETDTLPLVIGGVVALLGVALAWLLHGLRRDLGEKIAETLLIPSKILEGKYWLDELYQLLTVVPLQVAGALFGFLDRFVFDGIVMTLAAMQFGNSRALKLMMQRGYLQGYALTAALGVAAILFIVFLF